MRVLIALGCLLAAMSSAFAADLPVGPAPMPPAMYAPAPPPTYTWTGFYLGIDGGYGFGQESVSISCTPGPCAPAPGSLTLTGYEGGGHAGFNFQRGVWVGGLEIDIGTTGIKGTSSVSATSFGTTTTTSATGTFDYLASARARIGVAPYETLLIYGTGGVAGTRVSVAGTSTSVTPGPFGSTSTLTSNTPTSLLGWVAGVGVEASLANVGAPDVLVRVEDLFYDFGTQGSTSSSFSCTGCVTTGTSASTGALIVNVVRAGLSIKF